MPQLNKDVASNADPATKGCKVTRKRAGLTCLVLAVIIGLLVLLFFSFRAEVTMTFRNSAAAMTPQGIVFSPSNVGPQTPANASVETIEYLVSRIMICTSLSLTGTAFQPDGNCVELYSNNIGPMDTRSETLADLLPLVSSFTNFVNPASLASLKSTTPIDLSKTGSYNWGVMSWHSFMRLKATVTTDNGVGALGGRSCSCWLLDCKYREEFWRSLGSTCVVGESIYNNYT